MANCFKEDSELYLARLLSQTARAMIYERNSELKGNSITSEQASVLMCLKCYEYPPTPAEISRCIFREPNSTTGLVNRMVKSGLLQKTSDPDRSNMVRIHLTPKGETATKTVFACTSFRTALSGLDVNEQKELTRLLLKVRGTVLDKQGRKSPTFMD